MRETVNGGLRTVGANPTPAPAPSPALTKPQDGFLDGFPLVLEAKHDEPPKAVSFVGRTPFSVDKKISGGSFDRDVALAEIDQGKKLSFIKAWEESQKTKAENRAQKKLSAVAAWENSKKACLEAMLRKFEVLSEQ